jgi:hypothetical protein
MEGCKECKEYSSLYDTVGKTYYKLEDHSILCYRHWHQAGKPEFKEFGEYINLYSKLTTRKNEKQQTL